MHHITLELHKNSFLGTAWGKSWDLRKDADIPNIKKLIPLYRVAGDLLPRAIYMQKTGEFPCGMSIQEIAEGAGISDVTEHILDLMSTGEVKDEDLELISSQVGDLIGTYCTPEHSKVAAEVLSKLSENPREIDKKSKIQATAIGDKPLSELQKELEELTRKQAELALKAPNTEIEDTKGEIRDD